MVDPPREGRESESCVNLYNEERDAIMGGLAERAALLTTTCNEMDSVTCNKIEGSMYGFPRVHFSEKARARAAEKNCPVDFMYCMDMVN